MIEMWEVKGIQDCLKPLMDRDGGLLTAHSAEGPGGFIEACHRKENVLRSFAITLRSEARNVPGWRKAVKFLSEHPMIDIHDGADGTGNILSEENQAAFIKHVHDEYPKGVHIYTADGGFDFSNDYNAQEDVIFPLLLAEILIGIQVLQKGGCFIVKCFDTTERQTLELLWLTSQCFREWSIVKPRTSRAGNAERYFIGKGFLGNVEDILACMKDVQAMKSWNAPLLDMELPKEWVSAVLGFQEEIEMQEIAIIQATLDLIHQNDFVKVRGFVRENIKRSIQWCEEHNEPVSSIWYSDSERNITKETQDLLQILCPNRKQPHSWYTRTNTRNTFGEERNVLSFEGFRRNDVVTDVSGADVSLNANPFMRERLFRT
jgi:23S rRNA U2552 (ribose-2'-O)-methylase RlmE/FtsJ